MPTCSRETVVWAAHQRGRARSGFSSSSSSEAGSPRPGSPTDFSQLEEEPSLTTRLLGWYPALVLRIARQMLSVALFLLWSNIFLSAGLCMLDFVLKVPLSAAKWILSAIYHVRGARTVIVTGSSLETLQVARNYYQCGARVVVIEHDDQFGLVRFSTAVDKLYKVPVPQKHPEEYVRELCRIAERENAAYFIPTATSNPAHFDALAKPHLEQLGVSCVCPGVKETFLLDDPLSLLQICHDAGLTTPVNYRVSSPDQLTLLYEEGHLRRARHVLLSAGPLASREDHVELELPQTRRGFRRLVQTQPRALVNICTSRPALVLQVPEGERLVTCTTVRDNKVVANVTCRAPFPGEDAPPLVPLQRDDVDVFVSRLMSALPRVFNGHLTITLICTRHGLVPIRCKLGVSLPYLCYSNQHARIFLRPCKHNPKPPTCEHRSRYWLHESLAQVMKTPSVGTTAKFLGTVVTRSEALLTAWDPIPACVYYGLQVPAKLVYRLVVGSRNKVVLNQVHFSSDKPQEFHLNNNITSNNKRALSIPVQPKNGTTVRTNGCAVVPSGDLIQL